QRITTLTLLFRAFYEHFKNEGKNVKQGYLNGFGRCIWKFDSADEELYFDEMHLRSEVEFDDNKEEFAKLLSQDIENLGDLKSKYAKNYTFFYDKISSFKQDTATQWEPFCKMLLGKKLFVLFITCDSQESAMTIFNTLNSRGMPLSNADILKGYIYKHKKTDKDKKEFAQSWKNLYSKVDDDKEIKSLDFLFLQFMHIIRAQHEDFDTTTQSVLNFFTKKDKKVYYGAFGNWLYKDETMPFILHLADFWLNPQDYLSRKSTNYLKILNLFQNDAWKSFVSCLVWKNHHKFNQDDFNIAKFSEDFDKYLPKLTTISSLLLLNNNATINTTKEIIFKMNVALKTNDWSNIQIKQQMPNFETFLQNLENMDSRKIKFILFLYANIYADFTENVNTAKLQIEHILPKQWQNANFNGWNENLHNQYLEQIGNKILLPDKINIKCSDHFFAKKQDGYKKNHRLKRSL
ncbi:LOW QUALITY PROTEIN: hypothetical protein HCMG_01541, partial [Helicobacter canadensis MIT 98-5491]